jgi:hypothetical protein
VGGEVEAYPDYGKRQQHADEANVDLGRVQETAKQAYLWHWRRSPRRSDSLNHWRIKPLALPFRPTGICVVRSKSNPTPPGNGGVGCFFFQA